MNKWKNESGGKVNRVKNLKNYVKNKQVKYESFNKLGRKWIIWKMNHDKKSHEGKIIKQKKIKRKKCILVAFNLTNEPHVNELHVSHIKKKKEIACGLINQV